MKKKSILTALLLAVTLIVATGATAVGARAQGAEFTVTGEAILHLKPDGAVFDIGVVTQNDDPAAAEKQNAADYRAVYNALIGAGLKENDICCNVISSYPLYDYEHGKRTIGYEITRTINCRVRGNAETAVEAALNAGAVNLNGFKYVVDDYDQAYLSALALALDNARQKAEAVADGEIRLKEVSEEQCYWSENKYVRAAEASDEYAGCAEINVRLIAVYES